RKLTSWIEDLSITVAYWSFDSRGQAIARVGPTRVFINAGSPWGTEEPRTREAIRHIGTNCLPKLVQLIRHQDSPFSLKVLSLLQRQSLLKLKIYSADEHRAQAFRALTVLGTDAAPAWTEILLDEHLSVKIRETALLSLGYAGPEAAVPPLIACLSVTNIVIRTNAAMLLSSFGYKAKAAIPALLSIIGNENDPAVRTVFADALRHCEPDTVVCLIRSLMYDPPTFRAGAATSLGLLKQRPEVSIPALIFYLDDPDAHVRESAVSALADFGPEAHSATPSLLKACNDPKKYVRIAATNALAQIDPH
ncbi:MAG TPA: HEAT repeat domain-containing protein, partial [Verrucomicrobiae bacterium]|nr:HEAT repeat domain-containing protein [Verrucomicrobiae bacterium]